MLLTAMGLGMSTELSDVRYAEHAPIQVGSGLLLILFAFADQHDTTSLNGLDFQTHDDLYRTILNWDT